MSRASDAVRLLVARLDRAADAIERHAAECAPCAEKRYTECTDSAGPDLVRHLDALLQERNDVADAFEAGDLRRWCWLSNRWSV